MLRLAASVGGGLTAILLTTQAFAQTPTVRLAAGADCAQNVNCIPGFKRVYGLDPTPVLSVLTVADAGVQALDDGTAEVAVAFSSNPQLSRPDILTLRDDKAMISADHVVPVVAKRVLDAYGAPLRRRLNLASSVLSTLELRGLNQQVIDGRLPEAVGGEFADANGLGGPATRTRRGPVITVGYQAFDENQTLAHFYGEALRGAGFRVRVLPAGGLRPAAVSALRKDRIDLWPGYTGSLVGYLRGSSLPKALAKIGATAMRPSPAQDRNGFAMKRDTAAQLGITTLSDLAKYWPKSSAAASRTAAAPVHAATIGSTPAAANRVHATASQVRATRAATFEERQEEQWAVAPGSLLDLPGAWQLARGQGVTVAIVDTGARLTHADLAPNIWTNFDEIPDNRIDDDRNGYIDDVHGVDLSTTNPGQDLTDGHGHGTHVAGIVAAVADGRGVVGVAPAAKLMIVKVLGANGTGTTGGVAEGIRYAVANGAQIINLSLGGDTPDPRQTAAIQEAANAGTLVVASAGNDSRDIDARPNFPAATPASNLLAVAATDPSAGRNLSEFSNFGRLAVQVAAPGGQILSTAKDGGWEVRSGTSMAAPMVTGVAALALSANPRLRAVDLRALLLQNATRSRLPVASGYVDALHSVLAASSAVSSGTNQPPQVKVLGATATRGRTEVQIAALGSTAAVRRYELDFGRKVVQVGARPSPFRVVLRRRAKRVRVDALDAAGHRLATATARVAKLKRGKGGVGTGTGVGT